MANLLVATIGGDRVCNGAESEDARTKDGVRTDEKRSPANSSHPLKGRGKPPRQMRGGAKAGASIGRIADDGARKRAGLTQHALAERLERPQSFVAKVGRGERRLDVIEFATVATAIGVNPVRLFSSILKNARIL